jgi:cephalosporin hydroxylase
MRRLAKKILKPILFNPFVVRLIVNWFHLVWYTSPRSWKSNTYLGYAIKQCPLDLQLYQELIWQTRPAFILQTGVEAGGSIVYFATLLDLARAPPSAIVIGVDILITDSARSIDHPRVRLVEGDSTSSGVIEQIVALLPEGNGLVSLDSNHSKHHVAAELKLYSRFVSPGSYLVVEDTNINGHPVQPNFGPGPLEAVDDFLRERADFRRDDDLWQRNLFSFHQRGWLRRTA